MSVLRSRRNISKTEYENTLANLYRYSMNKTIAVPKRRRKWLCAEIDGIMNKVYSDVMELGTGYIPDVNKKEEFTVKTVNDSVRSLYLLQKPLLVLWNVQRYETKVMVEWASFIKKEQLLLDTLIGREGEICNMVILDWCVINSVNFLKNMSELHRYMHGKVANACMAYDNTHGKLLIDTVNDAFYYLMLANRKIPTTQKEYIKRSFFDSIPHKTCLDVLNENFNDKYIKGLTMAIIKSYQKSAIKHIKSASVRREQENLLEKNLTKGICLGSQISQIMALAVPGKLDHYIKDRRGVKHYIRYMDDGVVFSDDKQFLHELYQEMRVVCDRLGLVFNEKKTRIVKISKGFTFMKVRYRVTANGKIIRTLAKSGTIRMRRKLKKFRRLVDNRAMTLDDVYNSIQSWVAHSKVAMSYRTVRRMMKLYNDLFGGYKLTKKYKYLKGGKNGELLQADKRHEFYWSGYTA